MITKLARGIELPRDAATQPWAFLGHRGSGKTYAAMRLAEELLEQGDQVVALDPVGVWYGLRLKASGKSASPFKLPVLGGLKGDIPLEHTAGRTVADFVVDTGSSAVLDVSMMRKAQRKEFVADFAEQLFQRQKEVRRPLHVAIEEAQVFAPQRCDQGEQRMLGAIEDIVRIGRNFGLGCSMISQRPQSVNKEVLNQAEPLVVFRLIAKHERDAVAGWLKHQGESDGMVAELHSLKQGDCYFWSPAWAEVFEKTRFTKRATFDASSTPTAGEAAAIELKPVNLKQLNTAMAASLEQAAASDPKKLRARIRELEQQLAKQAAAVPEVVIDERAIEVAVEEAMHDRDGKWLNVIKQLRDRLSDLSRQLAGDVGELVETRPKASRASAGLSRKADKPAKTVQQPAAARLTSGPVAKPAGGGDLGKGERAILLAIAQYDGIDDRSQLTIATGYKRSSRDTYLQRLSARGLVDVGPPIAITPEGLAELGDYEPLPTGQKLQEYWLGRLSGGEEVILRALCEAWPDALEREALSEVTGYKRSSRDTYLQRLSARKLIDVKPQPRASDLLFGQ